MHPIVMSCPLREARHWPSRRVAGSIAEPSCAAAYHIPSASKSPVRLGDRPGVRPSDRDQRRAGRALATALSVALATAMSLLSACVGERPAPAGALSPAQARENIDRSIPSALPDRAGWTADIYAGFNDLGLSATPENACAVAAVIEQESSFRVDPVVPGLPAIAWREIDERAAAVGVPQALVHGVLQLKSATGRSYGERIDGARTEKELSDIFEDFIGAVPMGRTLFAEHNPIRTRGPMQVHVLFAEKFATERPYPYPVKQSIADEVFTRRGGLYFGIAHLLDYQAPYDRYLYRFADFNAGQYASRNAAFQQALAIASHAKLVADGALLPPEGLFAAPGTTELAARALAPETQSWRGLPFTERSRKERRAELRADPVVPAGLRVGGANREASSASCAGSPHRTARSQTHAQPHHRMVRGASERTVRALFEALTAVSPQRQYRGAPMNREETSRGEPGIQETNFRAAQGGCGRCGTAGVMGQNATRASQGARGRAARRYCVRGWRFSSSA